MGGWHFWSGQIIYFHHRVGRKIYFRVNRGENIYFKPQQIFEKARGRGWGGGVRGRLFDSEGGGGGAGTFGRDRLFVFITDSAGKFISV